MIPDKQHSSFPHAPQSHPSPWRYLVLIGVILLELSVLYVIFLIYSAGQTWVAIASLVLLGIGTAVYFSSENSDLYPYRFLFPGLLTFGIFVIFPIVYTFAISFTNYGVANLYSYDRIWDNYFSKEVYSLEDIRFEYNLYQRERTHELLLINRSDPEQRFVVADLDLKPNRSSQPVQAEAVDPTYQSDGKKLDLREIVERRGSLKELQIQIPREQGELLISYGGLREFKDQRSRYERGQEGSIRDRKTGDVLQPNFDIGYFLNEQGQKVGPGFSVGVGLLNYRRIFADPQITGPFLRVFLWTLLFSLGSVAFSFLVGGILAVILNWESLHFRQIYRALYTLPYAVPAFISILVFRGLFNPSFGEINQLLEAAFGIQPEWFVEPALARCMVLIVNTWLSYPYMMILVTGILQSIPHELYEASAIDGSGPLRNFFQITLPLMLRPILPVLISSFAFAFNNFVLIFLLTGGGPNMVDTSTPVGETDILVSYTYRLAFGQAEAQYGFAAAIATVIYGIVLVLAAVNLRFTASQRSA